jgi:hypothetical protein
VSADENCLTIVVTKIISLYYSTGRLRSTCKDCNAILLLLIVVAVIVVEDTTAFMWAVMKTI